jgi:uncharacterized membrane protein
MVMNDGIPVTEISAMPRKLMERLTSRVLVGTMQVMRIALMAFHTAFSPLACQIH